MRNRRKWQIAGVAVIGALALGACSSNGASSGTGEIACSNGSIKAAGSSAQKNAMADWVNSYQSACSEATIDYQANGSGAGVQDFINKQTAFAGSDSAMSAGDQDKANARCGSGQAINVPMVGGAINLSYNVAGLNKLTLTPTTAAGIFASTITKWNDPAIAKDNPGVTLPAASIAQFHRSDSSGTTDNFTKYLNINAAAGGSWKYGSGKDWTAPGGQGSKGNDGVAASIKATSNSIGYVELSFAQSQGLVSADIDNGGGAVTPTSASAATALALAKVNGSGGNLPLVLDYTTKQAGAYPIVLVTYEITCQRGLASDQLGLTKSFLTYTASNAGQANLAATGYVPLTGSLLSQVQSAVASIA